MKKDVVVCFDLLVDSFGDGSDEIQREDVGVELHDNWQRYLDAGCDATKVAEMMSAQDVWEHYEELREHGARINLDTVYEELFGIADEWNTTSYTLTIGDTVITLETLKSRGISDEMILRHGLGEFVEADYVRRLLSLGVNADKVFSHCDKEALNEEFFGSMCYDLFGVLHEYGYPTERIKAWLDNHVEVDAGLLDDLFDDNDDDWTKFGIDLSNYADMWLQSSSCRNIEIGDVLEYYLPECISQEKYISTFSADELIKDIQSIEECYEGDIEVVAKIILDAKGYPEETEDDSLLYAYCTLLDCESELINRDKLAACIEASKLPDASKEEFREWLAC